MKTFLFTLLMLFSVTSFATPKQHTHRAPKVIHHHHQIHHHHKQHALPHHPHHGRVIHRRVLPRYHHHHHHHSHGHVIHRRYVRPCPPVIAVPAPYYNCAPFGGQLFLSQGPVSLGLRF